LTPKEMVDVMNKMGDPLSEEEATELVMAADIDGDGKLNFEEVHCQHRMGAVNSVHLPLQFYKVMTRLPDGSPVAV